MVVCGKHRGSIAALSGSSPSPDWKYSHLDEHTSRSSPDGRYLAFMSQRSLTGYDNTDVDEAGGEAGPRRSSSSMTP